MCVCVCVCVAGALIGLWLGGEIDVCLWVGEGDGRGWWWYGVKDGGGQPGSSESGGGVKFAMV